jgi:L,D-peptidoglycan transpeptidase YkuD (ErfK/YbiS/YcfS/YnhG family)
MIDDSTIHVIGNQLIFQGKIYSCAIGKNGFSADKKEGDGCTPFGVYKLRECWYRADRMFPPETNLPLKIIGRDDGWCDDPASPDYNKHIKLPSDFSHEKLWWPDSLYDLIIPIGYNDDTPVAGKGSAIFLHIAQADYGGTEGCVALARSDLFALLPYFSSKTSISIEETK